MRAPHDLDLKSTCAFSRDAAAGSVVVWGDSSEPERRWHRKTHHLLSLNTFFLLYRQTDSPTATGARQGRTVARAGASRPEGRDSGARLPLEHLASRDRKRTCVACDRDAERAEAERLLLHAVGRHLERNLAGHAAVRAHELVRMGVSVSGWVVVN